MKIEFDMDEVKENLKTALMITGINAVEKLKAKVPVAFGRLRDSIDFKIIEHGDEVQLVISMLEYLSLIHISEPTRPY